MYPELGDLIDNARDRIEMDGGGATPRFTLKSSDASRFDGVEHSSIAGRPLDIHFAAGYPLFLIREAWNRGLDLEALADGFGPGRGTEGGDWSGIRDSTASAKTEMLEAALNFLFPRSEA